MTSPIHVLTRAALLEERRVGILTTNLANVSTDGFKPEVVGLQREAGSFGAHLVTRHDLRQGALRATETPTDLALEGDGFLLVQTPDGERLTRGGQIFRRPTDGVLVDGHGAPLLGDADGVPAPLTAPDGPLTVHADGAITVHDVRVGRLRIVWPQDAQRLLRVGEGYYSHPGPLVPAAGVQVRQGFREQSGVDQVSTMVDLLSANRRHQSTLEGVRALDAMLETAATALGRVP